MTSHDTPFYFRNLSRSLSLTFPVASCSLTLVTEAQLLSFSFITSILRSPAVFLLRKKNVKKEKRKRKKPPIPPQAGPDNSRPRWSLRADDLAGPGLVLRSRVQMCDDHLHCLHLLVLGWDGTHFIRHLVALHRNVLALDAA